MIALIDGDVFVRPAAGEQTDPSKNLWSLPGWQIQRKPERQQRACWQVVSPSECHPLAPPPTAHRTHSRNPRLGGRASGAADWKIEGLRDYEYSVSGPTTLLCDNQSLETDGQFRWPI